MAFMGDVLEILYAFEPFEHSARLFHNSYWLKTIYTAHFNGAKAEWPVCVLASSGKSLGWARVIVKVFRGRVVCEWARELSDQKWFLGNWFVTKGISLAVKSRSDRISFMHYHMQFVCYVPFSTLERENVLCARALNIWGSRMWIWTLRLPCNFYSYTQKKKSYDFWVCMLTPVQDWLTNCNALTWQCVCIKVS